MTIAYEVHGSGPQGVLLMHDWMSTAKSYDDVRPYLDTDRFTYIFPDLRGYGRSRHVAGENTVAETARDMVTLADRLGWDRFDLVGHSMSAMVAQRVVLDAPRRVRSLIAVTPVGAGGMQLDAEGAALFAGAATDDANWQTVAKMVTGDRLPQRWYDERLRRFRASVEPAAFLRFLEMWTRTDFSAEMVNLLTPTLVIVGRHDFAAFSEQAMRDTFGRWFVDCEISVLEEAGHYPMSETPPRFAARIEAFLARQR